MIPLYIYLIAIPAIALSLFFPIAVVLPILVLVWVVRYAIHRRSRRRSPERVRLPIDPAVAYEVFWLNDGLCVSCGCRLAPRRGLPQSFEVDHIIPFSQGGPCSIDNLQPLCRSCNRSKSDEITVVG